MKNKLLAMLVVLFATGAIAQNQTNGVSIADDELPPKVDAMLDVTSDSKGMLIPRVSKSVITTGALQPTYVLSTPGQDGLLVFVTDGAPDYGYWYFDYNIGDWVQMSSGGSGSSLWTEDVGANVIYNSNTSGNVGIGSSTPDNTVELDITSNAGTWTTANWQKAIQLTNASMLKWRVNSNGWRHGIGQTSLGLYFVKSQADDNSLVAEYTMFISNNGYVGIGTTSPTQIFSVANGGVSVKRNPSTSIEVKITEDDDVYGGHYNEINCDGAPLDLQFANGQGVRIGSVVASSFLDIKGPAYATAFVTVSDSALKNNIVPIVDAMRSDGTLTAEETVLSKIKDVELYSYNYISDPTQAINYGVLAQQLSTVFPGLVISRDITVDKGTGSETENKIAVNYQGMTVVLFQAVKDLNEVVSNLQTKIDDHASTIQSLQSKIDKLKTDYTALEQRVSALEGQ